MHGEMKVYAGTPAAARHYMEGRLGAGDDDYLAEGKATDIPLLLPGRHRRRVLHDRRTDQY
jgi:hypothetical protein